MKTINPPQNRINTDNNQFSSWITVLLGIAGILFIIKTFPQLKIQGFFEAIIVMGTSILLVTLIILNIIGLFLIKKRTTVSATLMFITALFFNKRSRDNKLQLGANPSNRLFPVSGHISPKKIKTQFSN